MKKIAFIVFFNLSLPGLLFGQITEEERRSANRDRDWKIHNELMKGQEELRGSPPKIARFYTKKLTKEQKKRITPSDENSAKFKPFLKLSNTGIVKILANPKCDLKIVNANDLKCVQGLPIPGMGSHYSFTNESHSSNSLFVDISLIDNMLLAGVLGNPSGLFVDLGDTNINSISLKSEEIQSLANILPARNYPEMPQQRDYFAKGFESKNKLYTAKAFAKPDTTYALRSIKYYKIWSYGPQNYYDDLLLVFRIVEMDSEGGVTLIWKELKKRLKVKIFK